MLEIDIHNKSLALLLIVLAKTSITQEIRRICRKFIEDTALKCICPMKLEIEIKLKRKLIN